MAAPQGIWADILPAQNIFSPICVQQWKVVIVIVKVFYIFNNFKRWLACVRMKSRIVQVFGRPQIFDANFQFFALQDLIHLAEAMYASF